MTVTAQKPSQGIFPVSNGTKQGCVLTSAPFSITFPATLTNAFRNCDQGISINYRRDGKLFNLSRLHAFTMVKENMLRDFLFTDGYMLNAHSEPEVQYSMDKIFSTCDNFNLTISTMKTEVMH